MRSTVSSGGYTIVEVTLFLGITSLLLLITIFGTGTVIQSNRFTDSSRTVHAYVQKKYDDLLSGVNVKGDTASCNNGTIDTSTDQAAGTSNCLLMGKLVVFKQNSNTLTTYDLIGTEPSNVNYNTSDEQLIYAFRPTIVRNINVENYTIPWGATFFGSKQVDTPGTPGVDALAFIRSPRSTRIVSYTYREPSGNYEFWPFIDPVMKNQNTLANFCLVSADNAAMKSKLVVTGAEGQDSIKISFDVAQGDCDGN